MTKRISVLLAMLLAFTLVISGCASKPPAETTKPAESNTATTPAPTAAAKEDIVIGCIQDLSGPASEPGNANAWGAEYAVKLINEAGGINGHKIKFISMDCKNDVQEGINVYRRLVDEYKVDAIVGPPLSNPMIAIAPLTEEDKVPIVGHFMDERATTDEATGKPWKYMFLAEPSCSQQSYSLASYAMEVLQCKTFGTLYDQGNSFAVKHAEPFIDYVKAKGGQVVAPEKYQASDKDFRAQVTKIVQANPDAVFIPNYAQGNALCYDQLREGGYKGIILGANTFSPPFPTLIKTPLEKTYFLQNINPEIPESKAVFDAYMKDTKSPYPKLNAIFGYDAVQLLKDAMTKAQNPKDKDSVAKLLEQCKDVPTGSGPITINAETHRTIGMPMYIAKYNEKLEIVILEQYYLKEEIQ